MHVLDKHEKNCCVRKNVSAYLEWMLIQKIKIAEVGNILPELVHLHLPRGEQVVGRKMGDPQSPQHE
jgi:hypothetical protein